MTALKLLAELETSNKRIDEIINAIVAERDTLKQQNAELAAQVEVLISVNFETLQHDLIIETERAIKQRDEYLRTKVSTAGHGGSHDTCFGAILRNYFPHLWNSAPEPAQCLLEVKADAGRDGYEACLQNIGYHEPEWQGDAEAYANKIRGGE